MLDIMQFIPLLLITIPWAVAFAMLARRLSGSPAIWFILAVIPVINWFFAAYVFYRVVSTLLDRSQPSRAVGQGNASD